MNVVLILGARPQFIKAEPLVRKLKSRGIKFKLIHTGQHYDYEMSQKIFNELKLPIPDYYLNINQCSRCSMVANMMIKIEEIFNSEKPSKVIYFGDTTSTIAGSLASVNMQIETCHVEAGLRSFNMTMPEEINRVITDRISNYNMCPTHIAKKNLINEGGPHITFNGRKQVIECVGDIMFDLFKYYQKKFKIKTPKNASTNNVFVTIHRNENLINIDKLVNILTTLGKLSHIYDINFSCHPNTKNVITKNDLWKKLENVKILNPLSYLETQKQIANSRFCITDSGGLQKECYFHKTPCIIMREETEWIELLGTNNHKLYDGNFDNLMDIISSPEFLDRDSYSNDLYGSGNAADLILDHFL